MTLSQWWQIVALYELILVWPLALVAFLALLRTKTRRGRVVGVSVLLVLFLPFIHRAVGDVYFDYLCEHKAGEFIYRTVDNVEGVLQMRPRDGSKDYFDRLQMADLPEDPWGHTNVDARSPWSLIGRYQFIETFNLAATKRINRSTAYHESMKTTAGPRDLVARFYGYDGRELRSFRKEFSTGARSEFGFTWNADRSAVDHLFNVYPGELLIKNINSGETLAKMKGYFRVRPYVSCPPRGNDFFIVRFLEKVLVPRRMTENAKVKDGVD